MRKFCLLGVGLVLLLSILACSESFSGSGTADPAIPRLTTDTGWFIDTTGKVPQETLKLLDAEADKIQTQGFQIGGAFFSNSLSDGMSIATKFGNENGIGSKKTDNGLAVVVFLDKAGSNGEKPAISVAVGKGLEGLLNDAKVGRFLDKNFVPARKEGKWEQGVVSFVQTVGKYLSDPKADEFKDPPEDNTWILWVLAGIFVFLVLDGSLFRFAITFTLLEATFSGSGGGGGLGGGGGFGGGGASR